eukprot:Sro878_g214751.1  (279) ;mRNA; r:25131-25967
MDSNISMANWTRLCFLPVPISPHFMEELYSMVFTRVTYPFGRHRQYIHSSWVTSSMTNPSESRGVKDDFILIELHEGSFSPGKVAVEIDSVAAAAFLDIARQIHSNPVLIETAFGRATASKLEFHHDGNFATIRSNELMNGDRGSHALVLVPPGTMGRTDAWGRQGGAASYLDGEHVLSSLGIYHCKSKMGSTNREAHVVTVIPSDLVAVNVTSVTPGSIRLEKSLHPISMIGSEEAMSVAGKTVKGEIAYLRVSAAMAASALAISACFWLRNSKHCG